MSDSRLFKILYYLLDKGHATAPELAVEFEVSVRTIYRDVEALSSANIPIYTEVGRNGGIYLMNHFILDRILLSEDEKEKILIALQSMSATGYFLEKEMLTKLSALFSVDTGNWMEVDFSCWGKQSYDNYKFELLKTAAIQHRVVEMIYQSSTSGKTKRSVWPLKLTYKSKEWYLKAFCLEKQDFRIFKFNRILDLKLLESTFTPIPYPQTDDMQQKKYSEVTLLFSKEIAYRVYDEFDKTQIHYKKNGDLIVFAKMPIDAWIIGYLLSFGTQVEIMKPEYLRKSLAKQAQAIYKKNKY